MQPTVTVITPAYNAEKSIQATIESVLEQDYQPIEHIVVDGASQDGTVEILSKYLHLRWISEPDNGQSHALNKGFAMAQGEIIGWLNADDCYRPGAIRKAVTYLEAHPEADLVYSDVRVVDSAGKLIRVARGEPFDLEKLLTTNMVKQPTVFMRRNVIETLGGVDETLHYVMDRELWLRAGSRFNLVYLPGEAFADFRFESGTKSHDSTPEFHLEWRSVLNKVPKSQQSTQFSNSAIDKAVRVSKGRYYFSLAKDANQHKKNRCVGLIYVLKSLLADRSLIFNRGIYKYMIYMLAGKRIPDKHSA